MSQMMKIFFSVGVVAVSAITDEEGKKFIADVNDKLGLRWKFADHLEPDWVSHALPFLRWSKEQCPSDVKEDLDAVTEKDRPIIFWVEDETTYSNMCDDKYRSENVKGAIQLLYSTCQRYSLEQDKMHKGIMNKGGDEIRLIFPSTRLRWCWKEGLLRGRGTGQGQLNMGWSKEFRASDYKTSLKQPSTLRKFLGEMIRGKPAPVTLSWGNGKQTSRDSIDDAKKWIEEQLAIQDAVDANKAAKEKQNLKDNDQKLKNAEQNLRNAESSRQELSKAYINVESAKNCAIAQRQNAENDAATAQRQKQDAEDRLKKEAEKRIAQLNPSDSCRTYSTVWGGYQSLGKLPSDWYSRTSENVRPGTAVFWKSGWDKTQNEHPGGENALCVFNHCRSTLDGPQGWSAKENNHSQWMIIDLGSTKTVLGVVTQGRNSRHGYRQWVKSYAVDYSLSKESGYARTDGGKEFPANNDHNSKVTNYFSKPVTARYIKIWPKGWNEAITMRAAVIVKVD